MTLTGTNGVVQFGNGEKTPLLKWEFNPIKEDSDFVVSGIGKGVVIFDLDYSDSKTQVVDGPNTIVTVRIAGYECKCFVTNAKYWNPAYLDWLGIPKDSPYRSCVVGGTFQKIGESNSVQIAMHPPERSPTASQSHRQPVPE